MRRLLALLAFISLLSVPALADVIMGHARVIDGDTIEVAGARIRLHGIDAPESGQSCQRNNVTWLCGAEASAHLRELVGDGQVMCQERDSDRYGRIVAVCHAGQVDVNAAMVRSGLALAYRHYSNDYVSQEAAAHAARRGLWAGSFIAPWDWRRGRRLAGEAANDNQPPPAAAAPSQPRTQTITPAGSAACSIKGNIGSNGERIYHLPGSTWYDRTRIDESRGERWFCSEAEARAAGWRPAGGSGASRAPAVTSQPSSPPPAMTPAPRSCCRVCRKGKACGNSCISRRYTCHQPPGCACDG